MTARTENSSGFQLPPEISFSKEDLPDGVAYVFRHETLGLLGRIVLQDVSGRWAYIQSEVVGDPLDPSTVRRAEMMEPLAHALRRRIEEISARKLDPDAEWEEARGNGSFGESEELIKSLLIACPRCGENVALLIFAPGAINAEGFEGYARCMYPDYSRLNVATWIIGPSLGDGPLIDRPANMLKVWPVRESVIRQQPATLHAMLDRLLEEHCR